MTRVSGAQNSFWFIDATQEPWSSFFKSSTNDQRKTLAGKICKNTANQSADGLIFIVPHAGFDFAWDFYNSDGSSAEMCGNAARCAVQFHFKKISPKSEVSFLSGAGPIVVHRLSETESKARMTACKDGKLMTVNGINGYFVNTGVPHFVIEQNRDRNLAEQLRKVSDFGPAGANITFVQKTAVNAINAVTFERGVEDFTLACGTGAVAAAVYLQKESGTKMAIQVKMPGGILTVENAFVGESPILKGQAAIEKEISLDKSELMIGD